MLRHQDLYHAPLPALQECINDWSDLIKKMQGLAEDVDGSITKPLKESCWEGKDADAGFNYIGTMGKEFEDAVQEARGIRDILRNTYERLEKDQKELRRITDVDLKTAGLKAVEDSFTGETVADPPIAPGDPNTWRGKDDPRDAIAEGKAARDRMAPIIRRVLQDATDAEETAAWALHVNVGTDTGDFDDPSYDNLWEAWQGGWKAPFEDSRMFTFDEMMRNLNSDEVHEIKKLMESNNPADKLEALNRWRELVEPHGPWDHKDQFARKFGIGSEEAKYQRIPGQDKEMYYDIWSNIHYGYVGRAAGIPETALDYGHRGVGGITGNTDDGDVHTVRMGMELYDKYGPNLTRQQFEQYVTQEYPELEKKGKIRQAS